MQAESENQTPRNCLNCIHWVPDLSQHDLPYYRNLAEWQKRNHLGRCAAVRMLDDNGELEDVNKLAFVVDAEHYAADLFTRAGFSCILHKGP